MPLWSWPVPTCCWEVRSWRELFQLSVMLKCWCASWRSALRHHYRHYAWLRKTKVSECQITLCDGTYGGKWWHTVYSGKVTLRYNSVSSVCVERSANQIGIDRRQKKKNADLDYVLCQPFFLSKFFFWNSQPMLAQYGAIQSLLPGENEGCGQCGFLVLEWILGVTE